MKFSEIVKFKNAEIWKNCFKEDISIFFLPHCCLDSTIFSD